MRRPLTSLVLLGLLPLSLAAASPARSSPPRTLILCLDGVGYSLVEEMYENGELPHFRRPSRVVVAFPSLTAPSLAEILASHGAPPPKGYEDYYFDPAQNEMVGGFFHRFRKQDFIAGTFRELFDWHAHPALMTMEYAAPVVGPWLTGHLTLDRLLDEFADSRQPTFFAYLDATDPLAHLSGQRFLRGLLKRLDRRLPALEQRTGAPVEVVVFSDHGNDPRHYRRARLEEALEARGYDIEKRLQEPHDVVLPQYGLVGSAVLFTPAGAEPHVAAALRAAEGVDVVAYRSGENALVVEGAAGRAHLFRRHGRYGYLPVRGDPLRLRDALEELRARRRLDARGLAPEDDWWTLTRDHVYPDPLRRLWNAFENVAHSASLVVSLQDGYYTGSELFDFFTPLQATHGNLGRAQSLGFVLTTGPQPLPAYVRGDRLLRHLGCRRWLGHAPRPWKQSLMRSLRAPDVALQ